MSETREFSCTPSRVMSSKDSTLVSTPSKEDADGQAPHPTDSVRHAAARSGARPRATVGAVGEDLGSACHRARPPVPAADAELIASLAQNPRRVLPLVIVSMSAKHGRPIYPVSPDRVADIVGDVGAVVRLPSVREAWNLSALAPRFATYGGAIRIVAHGGSSDFLVRTDCSPHDDILNVISAAVRRLGIELNRAKDDPDNVGELRELVEQLRRELDSAYRKLDAACEKLGKDT